MEVDGNGLEVLSEQDCYELLTQVHLGRVALTRGALPMILPVNFALLDGAIIIRTSAGSKMSAAVARQVVCFEADAADSLYHEGWSVTVTGRTTLITDPTELARARQLPLVPWAPRLGDAYVRIEPELVSGRRISAEVRARSGPRARSPVVAP